MIPTNHHDLLFDDRLLLEAALGRDALRGSASKTDCDCISYTSTADNEDVYTDQVATVAG